MAAVRGATRNWAPRLFLSRLEVERLPTRDPQRHRLPGALRGPLKCAATTDTGSPSAAPTPQPGTETHGPRGLSGTPLRPTRLRQARTPLRPERQAGWVQLAAARRAVRQGAPRPPPPVWGHPGPERASGETVGPGAQHPASAPSGPGSNCRCCRRRRGQGWGASPEGTGVAGPSRGRQGGPAGERRFRRALGLRLRLQARARARRGCGGAVRRQSASSVAAAAAGSRPGFGAARLLPPGGS